jgi:TfoX/Sxy family transcriptional regulator of competence genes
MAFNEELADRVRGRLAGEKTIAEKRMFGGVAFLTKGNMTLGVHGDELIVRVDPADAERALRKPGVRIFDLSGRPMKGWLLVGSSGLSDKALSAWIGQALDFAATLPARKK